MNKSVSNSFHENPVAPTRFSLPANRLASNQFSLQKYRGSRKRSKTLLCAVSMLALICGNTASASDSDNDGIDDITEGQFNGGVAQPLFNNRSFERPDIGSGFSIVNITDVPGWSTYSQLSLIHI